MIIAVDAHGGDYAPREVVKGAVEAAEEYGIDIALVGKKAILEMLVRRYARKPSLNIIEASQIVEPDEHPVQAIRSKPDSSIAVGTKLVKEGASIGANATIVCGVTIGKHSFIGAGAVVTKDVKDYALVVGKPARFAGWMCECGSRIKVEDNRSTCKTCNRKYVHKNGLLKREKSVRE